MKKLIVFVIMLMSSVCWADGSMDFYRYQCVPELGSIFIDTFDFNNPDEYGAINKLGSNKSVFVKLSKKHEIYAVTSNGKEFKCTLGEHKLLIAFKFNLNSQGQTGGHISIKSESGTLIENVSLFAYYGYAPLVRSMVVEYVPSSSKIFASFEVVASMKGSEKRPNFNFSRELNALNSITDGTIIEEENNISLTRR